MAVLTAKQRRDIPANQYGIPPKDGKPGRYPINDKEHARKALQLIDTGHDVTPADKSRIRRLASKMLYGKGERSEKGVKKVQAKKYAGKSKGARSMEKYLGRS
jgi:hypothetical protein